MAQKPETRFRRKLQMRLKEVPCSWFESIQQKTIEGTPDIIGCVNGVFVAMELKGRAVDRATVMQRLKLSRIAEAGGLGLLVHPDNLDNTIMLLIGLTEEGKNAQIHTGTSQRSEPSDGTSEACGPRED